MELTDLEITKRIAEIEGLEFEVKSIFAGGVDGVWVVGGSGSYSPLTDDGLIKSLICKHKVSIDWWVYTCTILDDSGNILSEINFCDMALSKAILLAIIKASE